MVSYSRTSFLVSAMSLPSGLKAAVRPPRGVVSVSARRPNAGGGVLLECCYPAARARRFTWFIAFEAPSSTASRTASVARSRHSSSAASSAFANRPST